jgi:hypothetical protein
MLIAQWDIPDSEWRAEYERQPLWKFGPVAIDPERNVRLDKTEGRTRAGTGIRYHLWQGNSETRFYRAHHFKAFSNGEAVEHCKRYLETHWKD